MQQWGKFTEERIVMTGSINNSRWLAPAAIAAAVLALGECAYANPYIIGMPHPVWIAPALLVIIIVETLVLERVTQKPWRACLAPVAVMNGVSTLAGIPLRHFIILEWEIVSILAALLSSFFVAMIIEAPIIEIWWRRDPRVKPIRSALMANLASYVMIAAVCVAPLRERVAGPAAFVLWPVTFTAQCLVCTLIVFLIEWTIAKQWLRGRTGRTGWEYAKGLALANMITTLPASYAYFERGMFMLYGDSNPLLSMPDGSWLENRQKAALLGTLLMIYIAAIFVTHCGVLFLWFCRPVIRQVPAQGNVSGAPDNDRRPELDFYM